MNRVDDRVKPGHDEPVMMRAQMRLLWVALESSFRRNDKLGNMPLI